MKKTLIIATSLLGLLSLPSQAIAHGGIDHLGAPWWQMWNLSPLILFNLTALAIIYSLGLKRLSEKSILHLKISATHRVSFYVSIFVLFLALISPIDPMSDLLGSIHMLQHTLLMMVAAPLLVVSAPHFVSLWALSSARWRRLPLFRRLMSLTFTSKRLVRPLAAWLLYSVTLWIWHLPYLYEAALKINWVHDLQHLAFFLTSYAFWSVLLNPLSRTNLNPAAGILYLFVASLHSMILGVLMTLSPSVWYETYQSTAPHFGLTAMEDQQLAGLIMWMPAGSAYIVVAVVLVLRLLNARASERVSYPTEMSRVTGRSDRRSLTRRNV